MSASTTTTAATTEVKDDGNGSLPIAALALPSPVNLTPMPKQRPVCITLDSLRIFILSISLISLVHFSDALVVEAILVLVPFLLVVHNDYENFISLGPGGRRLPSGATSESPGCGCGRCVTPLPLQSLPPTASH
ncbi:hypothetical protein V2G26_014542 [Clonostachys chloroleuca]